MDLKKWRKKVLHKEARICRTIFLYSFIYLNSCPDLENTKIKFQIVQGPRISPRLSGFTRPLTRLTVLKNEVCFVIIWASIYPNKKKLSQLVLGLSDPCKYTVCHYIIPTLWTFSHFLTLQQQTCMYFMWKRNTKYCGHC